MYSGFLTSFYTNFENFGALADIMVHYEIWTVLIGMRQIFPSQIAIRN